MMSNRKFHYRTIRTFDARCCQFVDRTDILTDGGTLQYTLDDSNRSAKSIRGLKRQIRNLAKECHPVDPPPGWLEIPDFVKLVAHGTIRLGR